MCVLSNNRKQSVLSNRFQKPHLATTLFALFLTATLCLSQPAQATDDSSDQATSLPAVSALNANISIEGGQHNGNDDDFQALGSVIIPVGHFYGLQLDGMVGNRDSETIAGAGAHFFYRDPAKYLFGIFASGHDFGDASIWRAAIESEIYLDRFSLEGILGYESLDVSANLVTSSGLKYQDDDHFFTSLNAAYYITDNFRLTAGYRYESKDSFGIFEAEYAFPSDYGNISLYAKGQYGDDDHERVIGGLKIYLHPDNTKSLIRRHREDDPKVWVPDFAPVNDAPAPAAPVTENSPD